MRGAGRFQVVRVRAGGRIILFRRRRKRRSKFSPPGRNSVDDGQGWANHGPAGRRDYRPHREGSRRALSRTDSRIRHSLLHAHRRARHARNRKQDCSSSHPDAVKESDLAGEPITAKLTKAPGNQAPIGGLKVVADSGWFAARPSGTENIYKIYAESFKSESHLHAIVSEAQEMVNNALGSGVRANERQRRRRANVPPFPPDYRASGLLLHVTSLPSPYGIGDLGSSASRGWIVSTMLARDGGSRCRSARLAMGILRISRCRRLLETQC